MPSDNDADREGDAVTDDQVTRLLDAVERFGKKLDAIEEAIRRFPVLTAEIPVYVPPYRHATPSTHPVPMPMIVCDAPSNTTGHLRNPYPDVNR